MHILGFLFFSFLSSFKVQQNRYYLRIGHRVWVVRWIQKLSINILPQWWKLYLKIMTTIKMVPFLKVNFNKFQLIFHSLLLLELSILTSKHLLLFSLEEDLKLKEKEEEKVMKVFTLFFKVSSFKKSIYCGKLNSNFHC